MQSSASDGGLDFAPAIFNSMDPIFSIPIYLTTALFPRLQNVFASRPWVRKLLSVALAGGFATSLIVQLIRRFWGQFLWNNLLYWTTAMVTLDQNDNVYAGFLRFSIPDNGF